MSQITVSLDSVDKPQPLKRKMGLSTARHFAVMDVRRVGSDKLVPSAVTPLSSQEFTEVSPLCYGGRTFSLLKHLPKTMGLFLEILWPDLMMKT